MDIKEIDKYLGYFIKCILFEIFLLLVFYLYNFNLGKIEFFY